MSKSPVPKIVTTDNEPPVNVAEGEYQLVLSFNRQAELTDVSAPQGMSLPLISEHLVVGVLHLAQQMGSKKED